MRRLLTMLLVLVPLAAVAQRQGEERDDEEVEEEVEASEEEATPSIETPTPADAAVSPTPVPEGIGRTILFRGECTRGGGPSACRVTAAAVLSADRLEKVPCADEKDTRAKIEARYFAKGTELDLYVRGAPTGTFVVAASDAPMHGCGARATGRRVGAPGNTYDFVALHPDDPAQLGAIRFPSGVQPVPQSIAVKALATEGLGPANISVRRVRRFRDVHPTASVLVLEAMAGDDSAIVIAEGDGPDPEGWKITWTAGGSGRSQLALVDAFDLGADGKAEILVERTHRGEPSEWILLRRDASGAWRAE